MSDQHLVQLGSFVQLGQFLCRTLDHLTVRRHQQIINAVRAHNETAIRLQDCEKCDERQAKPKCLRVHSFYRFILVMIILLKT